MRQIVLLAALTLCRAQAQNKDLDAALLEVFGTPPPSTTPSPVDSSTLTGANKPAQNQNGNLDAAILAVFGTPPPVSSPATTASPVVEASTLVPGLPNKEAGRTKKHDSLSRYVSVESVSESAEQAIERHDQPKHKAIPLPMNIHNIRRVVYKSCKMDDGRVGQCVLYYLCNKNNSIITDGIGVIDIRFRDGPCTSYMEICCLPPDTRDANNPITPSSVTQPQRTGCGWRNPDGVGFRTTGDKDGESKFGEFPWTVAILKIELVDDNQPDGQRLNVYVGGGSLIHPSVVLTAAHYVAAVDALNLRARAGEWDTQTTKEIYPYQDRDIASVVVHKDFNKGNLFYDIALLFLATPMDLAPNVGVACLPPPKRQPQVGSRCVATGWGKDRFGKEGRYQVILKKVEVPVVDRYTCRSKLRQTRLGPFFELHSSFMCAGGEAGKDTCKGDGGSPLSCPIQHEKDRYMQSGIVAWGIGCGENGTPGVYVDVANLRNWIDDKVAGAGFDPKVYTI